jgi:hypothetical protein
VNIGSKGERDSMYSYIYSLVFGRHQICIITSQFRTRSQEKKIEHCLRKDNPVTNRNSYTEEKIETSEQRKKNHDKRTDKNKTCCVCDEWSTPPQISS